MTLTLPSAPVVAPCIRESQPVTASISTVVPPRDDADNEATLNAADSAWLAATRETRVRLAHLAHLARHLPSQG